MRVLAFLICLVSISQTQSQILHTESFSVIIDTTKFVKGSILPDFKFQNLKEDLFEFENTSDITFRFKNQAFTFANKIELARFGKQTFLSGGFVYLEYRRIMENRMVFEPYAQLQWAEARGLAQKYATGMNLRYRILANDSIGLFVGAGPFYEYERWNYNGVREDLLPLDQSEIVQEQVKLGSYISFKWITDVNLNLDLSFYHQVGFEDLFGMSRLASSVSVKYKFTEHLGLLLRYQTNYDREPVVPIEKLFNKIQLAVDVSF